MACAYWRPWSAIECLVAKDDTMKYVANALIAGLFITGCATNAGVVQVSSNTFMLSKQDNSGFFGNFARFKADVIQEAQDFAAARGKVAIPVDMREVTIAPGRFGSIQYQFRLVDKDSPEAEKGSIIRQADTIIERRNSENITVQPGAQSDVYAELLRLDDLRKRGVLTDAEFEAEKARLLRNRR
jgi:outer membrane murein-binding lipoprotein Lpp